MILFKLVSSVRAARYEEQLQNLLEMKMSPGTAKLLLLVAASLVPSTSWCEDVHPMGLTTRSAEDLIEQLGGATFELREAAMRELARRGDLVRGDLQAALRHADDLEVRLRARKLLAGMAHADLKRRLAAFVADADGQQEHNLPGWNEYVSLLGTDKASRKLFAEMIEGEIDLLKAFAADKKNVADMIPGRIEAFENGVIPGLPRQASAASVATLLLLASDEDVPLSTSLGYQVYRFLNQSAARKAIEQHAHSPLIKRLLVVWIERSMSDWSLARAGLLLAERYEMNDTALSLARNLIGQKDAASYTLPYALLTIGRLGGEQDVSLIQTLLANRTVCHTWHNGKFEQPIQVQVRDVALAMLVHLTKQDHKQFGFELLRPDPNGLYYVYTMGFPDDTKRDEALAKWRLWSAKRAS